MAISDLQTALDNLDTEIVTLSAKAADPTSYSIENLQVTRQRLKELIMARRELAKLIKEDGSNIVEEHSRFMI